ncbi:MAG: oxaloacetate decarboxylase alpha subunit, partial [Phenylobacterium sp.]
DVLTYALFPQIGLKFLENRNNPDAFEKAPSKEDTAPAAGTSSADKGLTETYSVAVEGKAYQVVVAPDGQLTDVHLAGQASAAGTPIAAAAPTGPSESIKAPLAGNIFKIQVNVGDAITEGQVVIIMEAMKMETEIRASQAGQVTALNVKEGDGVTVGQPLISYA